jgi:1-acyl-sn-glycerol-3-phosphate acyltransferase
MFYWFMKHIVAGPLLRALFRPRLIGRSNIPKTGRIILASNHLSFIDSVILPLVIRRRIYFLAKSSYFRGHGFGGWALKRFLLGTGMLPLDPSGGRASETSLRAGLDVLGNERVLGIFPEGTRSPDGRMYRGRTGVARMVLAGHARVVPVAIFDTDKVMPVGGTRIQIRRIGFTFGEPLDFSRFEGREVDPNTLRAITDEIMSAIQKLSGQEVVDAYASARN